MVEWGVAAGTGFGLLVFAVHGLLPNIFTDDTAVLALTSFLLVWVAAMQPVAGVVFVLDGVLIGAGDLRFLAWAMVAATALFVPVGLGVLGLEIGIGWLWAALYLFMLARAVALGVRFAGGRWAVTGAVS
jgi:Na+-driven multidrug efflux pump